MKDKIKVLKTYRDCTGKNAIYLIKKTKPNEKKSFFSLGLRSICTNFSNGKLGGASAIQNGICNLLNYSLFWLKR
jgi:hypothetical protein